mgnify:FL=1
MVMVNFSHNCIFKLADLEEALQNIVLTASADVGKQIKIVGFADTLDASKYAELIDKVRWNAEYTLSFKGTRFSDDFVSKFKSQTQSWLGGWSWSSGGV